MSLYKAIPRINMAMARKIILGINFCCKYSIFTSGSMKVLKDNLRLKNQALPKSLPSLISKDEPIQIAPRINGMRLFLIQPAAPFLPLVTIKIRN